MADNYDQLALRWVKDEVEKTLADTQKALEAYVAEPEDVTRLRTCVTYLHQVRGTLQMLEFYGAALLAEEMEQLTESILNNEVGNADESLDVLMGAILQLPTYLERVQNGQQDMPLVLLPLLNDLRAARGQNLLTESSIFTPDLSQLETQLDLSLAQNPLSDEQVQERVRKLRHHYQKALLGLFRNIQVTDCFKYLHKVSEHIHEVSMGMLRQRLWWVIRAFLISIEHTGSYGTASVKALLGDIDRLIKDIVEEGNQALNAPIPLDQLKNLLYHIACTRSSHPLVDEVQQFFSLKDSLPTDEQVELARQKIGGPDSRAIATVVGALREDLANIKDTLDLAMRQVQKNPQDLESIPSAIRRVSDTLALLGLGASRDTIAQQTELVEQLINGELEMDDAAIMDVAGSLLYVEATLSGIAQSESGLDEKAGKKRAEADASPVNQVEFQQAYQALMREARVNIQQAKDAIVDCVSSHWNFDLLVPVTQWIAEVSACLELVDNERPSTILLDCGVFIDEYFCRQKRTPSQATLDALADALTGVEYYLEHIELGAQGSELLLDSAAESVQSIQSLLLGEPETSAEVPSLEPESLDIEPPALDDEEEIPTLNFLEDTPSTASVSTTEALPVDDMIDAEVVEIFIEEAQEELAQINQLQPAWVENTDDAEALGNFRRSYHTLKGSGRLVKAGPIAEMAWAVENLLNRILDNSVKPSRVVLETIEQARAALPELLQAFIEQRAVTTSPDALMEKCHALSRNESIAPTTEVVATVATTTDAEPESSATVSIDQGLLEVFKEEAQGILADIGGFVNQAESGTEIPQNVISAFHTLKGSANIAGLLQLAQVGGALETRFMQQRTLDEQSVFVLQDAYQFIYQQYPQWLEGKTADKQSLAAILAQIEAPAASAVHELTALLETVSDYSAQLDVFYKQAVLTDAVAWGEADSLLSRLHQESCIVEYDALQQVVAKYHEYAHFLGQYPVELKRSMVDVAGQLHDQLLLMLDNLAAGQPLQQPTQLFALVDKVLRSKPEVVAEATPEPVVTPEVNIPVVTETVALTDLDPELLSIFFEESAEILERCNENLIAWEHDLGNQQLLAQLQRDLHTLKGSARMTQVYPVGDLTHQLENLYESLVNEYLTPSHELVALMQKAQFQLEDMVHACREGAPIPVNGLLIEELQAFAAPATDIQSLEQDLLEVEAEEQTDIEVVPEAPVTPVVEERSTETHATVTHSAFSSDEIFYLRAPASGDMLAIFLEEAKEIFDQSGDLLERWRSNFANMQPVAELQRQLHTLKGGARMVELDPVAELAHVIEDLYEAIQLKQVSVDTALFDLIQLCHDRLAEMVDAITETQQCTVASDLIDLLQETLKQAQQVSVATTEAAPLIQPLAPQHSDTHLVQSEVLKPLAEQERQVSYEVLQLDEDAEETLAIYLPEAEELIENLFELLQLWTTDRENHDYIDALKRNLHTLKGGARLVQLTAIAELSHGLEILFAQNEDSDLNEEQFEVAYEAMEMLKHLLKLAETERRQEWPYGLLKRLGVERRKAQPAQVTMAPEGKERRARQQPVSIEKAAEMQQSAESKQVLAQPPQQEFIRVRSDLLDGLVNLAGETSIARGRIEQQFSQVRYNLHEMEGTIDRLRELLRRMEMETETQILSRERELSATNNKDFDPLEMDQYSQLHQLSRSLSESANDLLSLKDSMDTVTSETEALLLQQGRINTELQEGLMQARMIPFSSLVPRLRRMVRQIGGELSKPVQLAISAEGEMDRTVLERMVAPLEHMIRNAIDHGIEEPYARAQAGKSEAGQIQLRLFREGSYIVIEISDDGAGIDLNAVRDKAIERGVIKNDAQLSEHELLQLIFDAGFSTAKKVTQISGRGVGMDVVHSEIKQLGGDVEIQSTFGEGTRFTVRLPFTVSVNQALMVRVAEEHYAVPLTSISGIVEVHPAELQVYFASDTPSFVYADQAYNLRYAGDVLGLHEKPNLAGVNKAVPILLLHGNEAPVALLVDELNGSREITVKSAGPQLANVPGLSGATILGDGRVVLILDLAAMLRHEKKLHKPAETVTATTQPDVENLAPQVMVVDDSITVRKVTSRLLERNGYRVITAKDGVDAVNVLHDTTPDIMLLDIEMPRMDGFELASFIRHDERLMTLPIIMITSRTGQKHRTRAEDIGVNHYMGKPFQEAELLNAINDLLQD